MRHTRLLGVAASVVAVALLTTVGGRPVLDAVTAPSTVRLGVPGMANANASLAILGNTVAVVWAATKGGVTDVYAATSNDGGVSFSAPHRVNDQPGDTAINGEQAPRVAIASAPAPGPGGGAPVIAVIWPSKKSGTATIRFAKSVDGGRTFSPAMTIHDSKVTGAREWQSLAAAANGTFHAVWLDGRSANERDPAKAEAAHGAEMHHEGMEMKMSSRQDVFEAVLAPDGRITEARVATSVCFCCKTAVATGPNGRVNVAWRHVFPGNIRDIAFAASTDGGLHFSPLVRISEDKWELAGCPEDGPSMAVDATGALHIVWPTLVNDGEEHKAIFYATSRDGRAFSTRVRVSTLGNASHPQMALNASGDVIVLWDEFARDARRVMMARRPPGRTFSAPEVVSQGVPSLYPVAAAIPSGAFLVAWTAGERDTSVIALRRIS